MSADPVLIDVDARKKSCLPAPPPPLRVLLTDDEGSCHLQLRTVMELDRPCPIMLYGAESMEEAFRLIDGPCEHRPHVILQDLKMGPLCPFERTLEWIPLIAFDRGIPVLAFTGDESGDTWMRALKAGALNVLHKAAYLNPKIRSALHHELVNALYLYLNHPAFKSYLARPEETAALVSSYPELDGPR